MRENNRVALFIDVDNLFISAQNGGLPFALEVPEAGDQTP